MSERPWILGVVLVGLSGLCLAGTERSCNARIDQVMPLLKRTVITRGTEPTDLNIPAARAHTYLIEAAEWGNDAFLEILDPSGRPLARADHPERRSGTRYAVVASVDGQPLTIRITGKERANLLGGATVRVMDLRSLADRQDCIGFLQTVAQADADFAAGEQVTRDRSASPPGTARQAFLKAAAGYLAAQNALASPGDRVLAGRMALALAGDEYLEIQDWAQAADAAQRARALLAGTDSYRRARAESLLSAASREIALQAAPGLPIAGFGIDSTALLQRARRSFRNLTDFHLRRRERYDAGLQLTNIGLTYLDAGRYPECAAFSLQAGAVFGALGEIQRQAQARQNRAICLWGLGRLPEALQLFERLLKDIGPDPYPKIYLSAINNAALLDYSVGNFDEALRLFDRALSFGVEIQAVRGQAQTLYGIGVTYYALGDRDRAQQFLERSLAIRTPALDGHGRMATLRALAVVAAEQGRVGNAIAFDREALTLTNDRIAALRIRLQLAAHRAAAGERTAARAMLDALLAPGAAADALLLGEVHLRRAVLEREAGEFAAALSDLAAAHPQLLKSGNVNDEFLAELETARALAALGRADEALAAVERALSRSAAIRLQTANPELRAELQTPLRAAYDFKLELLWGRFAEATQAGHTAEALRLTELAFRSAEESRARTLADMAAQRYSLEVRQSLSAEFARRERIYRDLAARRFALEQREDRSGAEDSHAQALLRDIAGLQREADGVNTTIAVRSASRERKADGSGDRGLRLPPLAKDTALVAYWLGGGSAYAWTVSADGIRWTRLPAPASITAAARALHESMTRFVDVPQERRLAAAQSLYQLILQPLGPWLAGIRRWIVIPDGALSYVPFAALRPAAPAARFVVVDHDVALTPAAWMLEKNSAPGRDRARGRLLLVADPVYEANDPRLPGRGAAANHPRDRALPGDRESLGYRRLAYSAEEAEHIAAEFPRDDVDRLIGMDATRERLLALDWSKYRYLHLATHGTTDAAIPELSALVLSTYDTHGNPIDGAVRVADLTLRTLTADAVVLSACDTAVGKEVVSEGLVGIGYTALARGAKSVVASLWPVADEISARLMTEFYRHLLRDSMDSPAALGSAMRSLLAHEPSADPALWAPYQVSVVALGPGLRSRGPATAQASSKTTQRETP